MITKCAVPPGLGSFGFASPPFHGGLRSAVPNGTGGESKGNSQYSHTNCLWLQLRRAMLKAVRSKGLELPAQARVAFHTKGFAPDLLATATQNTQVANVNKVYSFSPNPCGSFAIGKLGQLT